MLDILKKVFGTKYDKDVKSIQPYVDRTNEYFDAYQSLTNDELRNKSNEFRQKISKYLEEVDGRVKEAEAQSESDISFEEKEELYRYLDEIKEERDSLLEEVLLEILPEAFAVVKETANRFTNNTEIRVTATQHDKDIAANNDYVRIDGDEAVWKNSWVAAGGEITWNMVHYDVQLIGGYVLHSGKIAEMQTGEGKTLVATLPAYLNGLSGQGVHVITVNDYLARRDCEWVGPIFEFLFLTVDCIDKYQPHSPERRAAYNCDITYGTNNEFGFDYLRDNMVRSTEERVQAKHHFAMIDEVDSVLIDDARTPLIISGPVTEGSEEQEYQALKPKVEKLIAAQRKMATEYLAKAKKLFAEGNTGFDEGDSGMALLRAYRSLPKYRPLIKFLSQEGVKAVLQKAENYYMQEQSKNMHLVDEPLLFTIDEKNRAVELTDNGSELLSKGENDTRFFVLPDIASEMQQLEELASNEGRDVAEEKAQLIQDFSIKSRRLHAVNQLLKAYTLFDREEEYVVIDGQVKIVDEQTGRMMEGRRYSDGLHQALEAKENVKVGNITQTYATITLQNYFRMYHKLSGMTGTAETEASEFWEIYKLDVVVIPTNKPIVRDDKEDLVYKTEREKFNAVLEEIIRLTEAGRPVLVGTTTVDISEKLSRMLKLKGIKHNVLNAKQHQREAEIVALAGKPSAVTIATNMAGRGTDIKLTDDVKEAGGLAIIATERHDSRRVDRQLRGRAGRQGDPGSSQFYVSLEDKLMRLFNSDRIVKIMDRMGHKDGEVIQHSMITKSIERAQKKVEENNFGIRKRLLEYDDVMNIQRTAIYNKRNNALSGERLSVDLYNMIMSLTESLVDDHKAVGDYDSFKNDSLRVLATESNVDEVSFKEGNIQDLVDQFQRQVLEAYETKTEKIMELLLPVIKNVYENEGHRYKRIAIPYTTSSRENPLPIAADLKKAVDTEGRSIMKDIEKAVTLALIDENWKEHLRSMDELKDSVQSASFEQKDPLVIYKMEAYSAFEQLVYRINYDVISYLMGGKLLIGSPEDVQEARSSKTDFKKVRTNRQEEARRRAAVSAGRESQERPSTFKRTEKKVKRNDPCPCGSGKKYKHCHGK